MPDIARTERPSDDTIPTITVKPGDKADGEGKPIAKGAKLSRDQISALIKQEMPGLSAAGTEGVVRNVMRESGGDSKIIGDGGTSGGMFQHHNTRFADLKAFAKSAGTDWQDPVTQVRFAAGEMKKSYPTLLAQLKRADDPAEAEDSFKRVFERPASVLWANKPKLDSDRYRFSDYALGEHKGRKNTDLVYMSPRDYLDLAPDFEAEPRTSASGKSLKNSLDRGDEVEAIPTLDMRVKGNTGTVTDQDGRHRALMAQDEGIEAIPVAIRNVGPEGARSSVVPEGALSRDGGGKAEPTEIQGLSGTVLPYDFQKAKDAPRSLFSRAMGTLIPSAVAAEPRSSREAAEPSGGNWWDKKPSGTPAPAEAEAKSAGNWWDKKPEPDGAIMSGIKGAAEGFGRTVLGGQELVGKGLEAASDMISPPKRTLSDLVTGDAPQRGMIGRAGEWLVQDARGGADGKGGMAGLTKEMEADHAAHPYATGAGEMVGEMAIPGGVAGKVTGNALRAAALSGGISGLLSPGSEGDHFWRDKALQVGGGVAAGAVTGKAGEVVGGMIAPKLTEAVKMLGREGVILTPGQIKGGTAKRAEDILANVPVLGSQIRKAQNRSLETFNRAAINRSLADINSRLPDGVVGHDAIGEAEQQFRAAYNSVIPSMRGIRDPAFMNQLNTIITRAHAQGTPTELPTEYINRLRYAIQNEIVDRFDANGHISGDLAQDVGTRLDGLIKPMIQSDNPYSQNVGRALREADKAFDRMMEAHNPALQAAKNRIDAGYAKFKTVQRAATATGASPDGLFTPAQLSRAVLARDRSKDKAAFARGDAMMQDLAAAGRDVLPRSVNDSGTVERGMLLGALSGAVPIEPHSAALAAAAMVPYTVPASKAMNAIVNRLSQQPGPTRNALAQMSRYAGQLAGSPAGGMAADRIPTMTVHPGNRQ
jgi:hypothetical protein